LSKDLEQPKYEMKTLKTLVMGLAVVGLMSATSARASLNPNGNPGDWSGGAGATTVPSGTGGVNAPNGGSSFTQLQNLRDDYQAPGYGDGPYSRFGNGGSSTYNGPFYQSVAIYIDTTWAPAPAATGGPTSPTAFWLDMSPYHPAGNYGAEHNFRFGATGSQVNVSVDGAGSLLYSITTSGWYDFQMTYQKGANSTDPVITDMNIYDPSGLLVATTQVLANSPGGPLESADLAGNGYVWFAVWQNGFAGDTLDVANVDTGVLSSPVPEPTTIIAGALLLLPFGASTLRILRKTRKA
jgi:hypothetical protein